MTKKYAAIIAIGIAVLMMLCACGGTSASLAVVSYDDFVSITADNAEKDSSATTSLKIDEGEEFYIEPDLEKGEIKIEFYDAADEKCENLITDFTVSGTEPGVVGIGTGDFTLVVTVTEDGTTGTAQVTAKGEEGDEQWTEAKNGEEAAKGAGLDMFEYGEGTTISLGEVKAEKVKYMEGVARADIPIGAVEMWICKGLASIDNGDISFDDGEYANEWTQNVKGLEVTCYGNRKGEATKTIWTSGDYAYAIVAHGAGGDDDYGLDPDDLSTLINSIQ